MDAFGIFLLVREDAEHCKRPAPPPTPTSRGSQSCAAAPSSDAVSAETLSRSSLEAVWDVPVAGNSPHTLVATSPITPASKPHPIVSLIQVDLQLILNAFPTSTSPKALCRALAYLLYSKHGWQVKFCCEEDYPRQLRIPAAWLEEVLVVVTNDGTSCLVDVNFRNKFLVRCPAGVDEQQFSNFLRLLPEVYIGLVDQLLLDVESCTAALEKIRQGTLPPWCCSRTLRALYKLCAECDPTPARECLCAIEAQLPLSPVAASAGLEDPACCLGADELDRLAVALSRSFSRGGGPPFSPSESLPLEFEKEEPCGPEDLAPAPRGELSRLLTGR